MEQSERTLIELGRAVADLQDEARKGRRDVERGAARLFDAEIHTATRGPVDRRGDGSVLRVDGLRRTSRWVWISAAAVLVLLLLATFTPIDAPVAFEVGDGAVRRRGAVGAWLAAPPAGDLPLHFSDGSLLLVGPAGRARVVAASHDGAEIALERGALELSVVHRARTRWKVHAGPFLIHVVGTRFQTTWDPATETFSVALREGAITVDGPIVGEGRAVHAGERIEVSTTARALAVTDLAGSATASSVAPPDGSSIPGPLPPPESTRFEAPAPSAAAILRREPSTWRALAVAAKYKDALTAAEAEGFESICAGASAADLHTLADAARLGGSAARAEQAFGALLDRYPGTDDASYAAFMKGRAAADQRHDYAGAARWFSRYLAERPGGRFAEEASGRLVEVSDAAGDVAGARASAERYLAAYPTGSHAAFAQRVLGRAGP